mgnify:CR=1 FL=1
MILYPRERERKRDSEEKDIQTKKTKCASLFIIGCFGVWSFHLFQFFRSTRVFRTTDCSRAPSLSILPRTVKFLFLLKNYMH